MSKFYLLALIWNLMSSLVTSQEMTKAENKSQWINQNTTIHPPITELTLTMGMLKLVDVVEVEEKIVFLFDYIAQWTDHRLKWNPLEYGGISHMYVPQKQIWLPEITIADAHEVKFFESDDAPRTAWVFKFPLDEHECGVSVLFHTYFPNEYVIKSGMEQIGKPMSELGNGEWKVTYVGVSELKSNDPNLGSVQRFVARFQRNPGFYVALVMIPAFFINLLSIIALFLNIEDIGEKITVGLTNIMAMTFILVILAAEMPKTAKLPLLAIYVIVGLVIVMTSIVVALILPGIRKYQEKKRKSEGEGKTGKETRIQKLYNWLRIEYVLMFIFQVANLVNFIILFL
ncbi:hypothetical protein GCK72_020176 [Caenorhabditis remanei]|uniref:Neurotransmitter-gated ion-channel ligand-binding domain-containing protein n=1 Tax=Caenorhabditis remanei TaxID=31234 RepID=A0A6A5GGS1_CAERE|nr:hypothetical protein GCK72_020176 [Caenorhabditis remanei]KAF1753619.1 hypothetical protein GCK72_020176 [Caenorhabditis remanei]